MRAMMSARLSLVFMHAQAHAHKGLCVAPCFTHVQEQPLAAFAGGGRQAVLKPIKGDIPFVGRLFNRRIEDEPSAGYFGAREFSRCANSLKQLWCDPR
eukprot:673263-Pelagomonas_calceolata.AAC.2